MRHVAVIDDRNTGPDTGVCLKFRYYYSCSMGEFRLAGSTPWPCRGFHPCKTVDAVGFPERDREDCRSASKVR